jgi:hypothetical protein
VPTIPAATATHLAGSLSADAWIILAVAVWAVGYVIACAIWPFAACTRCNGLGRFPSPSGRAWRACRKCKGSGRRVRTGHRIWEALRSIDRDHRTR